MAVVSLLCALVTMVRKLVKLFLIARTTKIATASLKITVIPTLMTRNLVKTCIIASTTM